MKRLLLIVLFLPLLLNAQIGEKNFIDQNYIEVTGKAEMKITPDLIYIGITLSESDQDRNSIASREKKMISAFKELGIDVEKDLMVKDISSSFKDLIFKRDDILLTKEFQLIVHDARTASKVFMELERLNISNVNIEKLDHQQMEEFTKDVKVKAVKAAYDKAQALASAIGQSTGKALFIQELDFHTFNALQQSNVMLEKQMGDVNAISQEPNIDFDKIVLNYSVLCKFELK